MNRFDQLLTKHQIALHRARIQTLQINVGRKCNQACRHCHVDAGPWRTETISTETAQRIAHWITTHKPPTVDITGGAPELSEHFRFLVEVSRAAGSRVIDRNNLTILEEPGFQDLPEFLAAHQVEIIASLPCYLPDNVTKQRGAGVYEKSIRALQKLNTYGYGHSGRPGRAATSSPAQSGTNQIDHDALPLHLVYNPVGPTLPAPQVELEADYREALRRDHTIEFTSLYTITNQPIARFAEDLRKHGQWDAYLELLANAFNPQTIEGLMCRTTISVGYQGEIYDCDFNQMLGMQRRNGRPLLYLWDITPDTLTNQPIYTGNHCLACTAGAGSSCSGAVI